MHKSIAVCLGLLVTTACTGGPPGAAPPPPTSTLRHLNPELAWYGENRAALDSMLDAEGRESPTYDRGRRPVATFDWDNTIVRNDVGFATYFWMLNHDKFLQPPEKDWSKTSHYLTAAGKDALSAACGALAEAGQPLPTSTSPACADELLSLYYSGNTHAGAPAFEGANLRAMEPSYAWGAAIQAGHTPDQLRDYANSAIDEYAGQAVGSTTTIGTTAGLEGYVRYYDQIRDLIGALQDDGFDVWIVSASPQPVVEVAASRVGIDAGHVIGVRLLQDADTKYTYSLVGCGNVGDSEDGVVTYLDGKRCWINKIIFDNDSPAALMKAGDEKLRPTFAAGDSDGDTTFLRDAKYRLTINRNGNRLMCYAYANLGPNWLVNPMFIEPRGQRETPYDCATACKNEHGDPGQCTDDAGAPLANQTDTVFGTP